MCRLSIFSSVAALTVLTLAPGCGTGSPPFFDAADGARDTFADRALPTDSLPADSSPVDAALGADVTDASGTCPAGRGFPGPPAISTGPSTASAWVQELVMADLDGDGKQELVVGLNTYPKQTVEVYRATGDGTFALADRYTTSYVPGLMVGDVNGDRRADIILTGEVLINDGTGRFPSTIPMPPVGGLFAGGDVNGDGKVDFANGTTATTVNVWRSTATGYGTPVAYDAGGQVDQVLLRDLDGNGRADLIVSHYAAGTVSVRLEASGDFLPPVDYPIGVNALVAIGDFDGDGKPELVGAADAAGVVRVFKNNGMGAFGAYVELPLSLGGTGPLVPPQNYSPGLGGMAIGDVTGDGKNDLVLAGYDRNLVRILANDGTGSLGAPFELPAGENPRTIAIGDVNGDGKNDLLTSATQSNKVLVRLSVPGGKLSGGDSLATAGPADVVITADVNGDGRPDLVATQRDGDSIRVFINTGTGFASGVDYPVGAKPGALAAGDFNGDGKVDIGVTSLGNPSLSVLLNNGNGTFAPRADYPTIASPGPIATADFDGDGKTDIVVGGGLTYTFMKGTGLGTFPTHVDQFTGVGIRGIEVGDWTGDGKPDFVLVGSGLALFANSGSGTFTTEPNNVIYACERAGQASLSDLNGDGKLDLAVTCPNERAIAAVLNSGGTRPFVAGLLPPLGGIWDSTALVVADFTGDGIKDVAVVERKGGSVRILPGKGDGTFLPGESYPMGSSLSLTAADYNGDGKIDLASTWHGGVVVGKSSCR